jgi:hypothetical protein
MVTGPRDVQQRKAVRSLKTGPDATKGSKAVRSYKNFLHYHEQSERNWGDTPKRMHQLHKIVQKSGRN